MLPIRRIIGVKNRFFGFSKEVRAKATSLSRTDVESSSWICVTKTAQRELAKRGKNRVGRIELEKFRNEMMYNSALDFRRRTIGLMGIGWFMLTAFTFLHFKNSSPEESREIIQIYMASCFLIVVYILQQLCRGRRVGFVKDIYVKKNGDLAMLTQSLTTRFPQGAVHEGKFRDVKIFVNLAAQDDDFTVIPANASMGDQVGSFKNQLSANGEPSSLLDKTAFSMISDVEVLKESRFPPEPKRGAVVVFPPGLELSENLSKFHTFALVITEQDLKDIVSYAADNPDLMSRSTFINRLLNCLQS